ncbi:MAG: hypothetical protein JNL88_03190 [Bacteroidia bacterium]|nr:hypothetical protein [Bacteroidia bacterium]
MDLTHLHLLLNHFPIIGTLIGTGLMAYALFKKEANLQRAVLVLWVLMTLITPVVMSTGEEAEETVENIAGVSENAMEEHEEAAEIALWLMIGLGVLSLAAIVLHKMNSNIHKLTLVAFVFSLLVFASMARTGYLGGLIRHTELNAAGAAGGGNEAAAEEGEEEEEH